MDNQGNETLRNMWEIADNQIHYTSGMMGNLSCNFALSAVLTNLYNSIMHLRHGAYTERRFFLKSFPMDMVRHEIQMISLCMELLDANIGVDQFVDGLNTLTEGDDSYQFESTAAILRLYPWNYELDERRRESIEKIRQAVTEMEKCMMDKREWRNICKLAYKIHNEPAAIF